MDVAVKLLRVDTEAEFFRETFLREARTVATLNHSNIVRVYNCGVLRGQMFIEMEYVNGLTLGDILRRRKRISPTLAIEAALCAAVALGHAGKEGFIHRDVKPDNIIVSRRGQVKLMDFGLGIAMAQGGADAEAGRGLVGSPPYMAPELIMQNAPPGVQSDIYALGATIFQLVTGRFPFEGRSIGEILKQHLKSDAPNLAVFAPGASSLNQIFQRMMKKNPEERYTDFRRVFMDLLGALHESVDTSFHESWGRGYFSRGLGLICAELMDESEPPDAASPATRDIAQQTNGA
jgi:serine/threonine-protein kinase